MKKTIICFWRVVLLCAQSGSLQAQLGTINHDPQDTYGIYLEYDTANHLLYGTGYLHWNGVDVNRIWQWRNGEFSSLDGGCMGDVCHGLELQDGELFFSGTFSGWVNGYEIQHLGRWDGESWHASGEPNAMTYLLKVGDELWCTGSFDTIGTEAITKPARYNGAAWEAFEGSLAGGPSPFCGALYQGEYYFGGNFTSPFILTEDIIKWDGDEWASVGGGIVNALDAWVNAMAVYQDKLVVGGYFWHPGNLSRNVRIWNGTTWEGFFPELVTCMNGEVNDLQVIDGKLYLTGAFRFAGPNTQHYAVLIYDGESLCGIGSAPASADYGQAFDVTGNADSIFFNTDTRVLSGDSVNYYAVWPVANGPDTCVTIPTSMRERRCDARLSAYPNPAVDEITVELPTKTAGPVDVAIVDPLGRQVMRYATQRSKSNRITLDVRQLATGSYVGRISNGRPGYFTFMKR